MSRCGSAVCTVFYGRSIYGPQRTREAGVEIGATLFVRIGPGTRVGSGQMQWTNLFAAETYRADGAKGARACNPTSSSARWLRALAFFVCAGGLAAAAAAAAAGGGGD